MLHDWHAVWQLLLAIPHHEEEAHESHSIIGEVDAVGAFALAQFLGLIIGCALQLPLVIRDLSQRVNVAQLSDTIKKLVAADNTERAIKLCAATRVPATMLLGAGLEALLRKQNPRAAMYELLPKYVKAMSSGYRGTLIIGVAAFAEGGSLLARGMSKGVGEEFTTLMLIMLGTLATLAAWNFIRWGNIRRELEYIANLLG